VIQKDQFGFNTFWWEQLHTEDQIKACVECVAGLGFKYVEFKRFSFKQEDLVSEFKMAVREAEAVGLKVSNFVVLRDLVNGGEKAVEDVIETIAACSESSVSVLNSVFGGLPEPIKGAPEDWWMPARPNHASGWETAIPAIEKICDAADRYGVDMAMETLAGTLVCDFYALQELFSRFDHPRLGVTLDPSHLLIHRNDIPYSIKRLGQKVKHVHMKDAVGRPGELGLDFLFPSLGAGGIDWKSFFGALDDIGYSGAVSGEYEQFKYMAQVLNNDPAEGARITYDEMNALHKLTYG